MPVLAFGNFEAKRTQMALKNDNTFGKHVLELNCVTIKGSGFNSTVKYNYVLHCIIDKDYARDWSTMLFNHQTTHASDI
jgi:hypothetical protein